LRTSPHAAHLTTLEEIETVFRIMAHNAARTLGVLEDYGIAVEKRADLMVIDPSCPMMPSGASPTDDG